MFLTHLETFPSILTGDGSTSPTPDTPTVTNRTLNSVSLEWEPLKNTSGTPVYIIGMSHTGDWAKNRVSFNHIFTFPRGTIGVGDLCFHVPKDGLDEGERAKFDGIYYRFHVAVVTENSSISYGPETIRKTILPMPKPVSNITVTSIEYDSNKRDEPRLKLTAFWNPPAEDAHVVTNYAMLWNLGDCVSGIPTTTITDGPDTFGSIYFGDDLKRCNPELTVYAINHCIPSNGTTITYEYPGCANTTNYPKETCYNFDPPDSPEEDRKVRNIKHRLAAINDDYTFNVNVTWDLPVYPYRKIIYYFVSWQRVNPGFYEMPSFGLPQGPSVKVGPLLPKSKYRVDIQPSYEDSKPHGFPKNFSIITPGVNPAEVTVRKLRLNKFIFSPQTGTFELNVTWEKPAFNYSKISAFKLSYRVNEGNVNSTSTIETYFRIFGVLHGQPISLNVTPQYEHGWISGTTKHGQVAAPGANLDEVKVRNLLLSNFILSPQTGKFDLNVSWEEPSFNYSDISAYTLKFRVEYGFEVMSQTNKTYFIVPGISYGEPVQFKITPHFTNSRIVGEEAVGNIGAPVPDDEEVKVQNLHAGDFVEHRENNTFTVTFTWKPPPFHFRDMIYYNLSYELSGYNRDPRPCLGGLEKKFCM